MGRKSKLTDAEKLEVILMLLRKQEPAATLARRYGVSEQSLYRWRDEFLEGGKSALRKDRDAKNGEAQRAAEMEKQLAERDRVIGELTIANRVLKKASERLL